MDLTNLLPGRSSIHFHDGYSLPHTNTGLVLALVDRDQDLYTQVVLQSLCYNACPTSLFLCFPVADGTKHKGISAKYEPESWTQKRDMSTFLLHDETESVVSHRHTAEHIINVCT